MEPDPSLPVQAFLCKFGWLTLAQLLSPRHWNVERAWFRCTASFRSGTSSHTSVYRGMSLNHNISSLVLNLFHNKFFPIQVCWFCLDISWVLILYLHDWKLSIFGQNFQNKKVILILAPSLLWGHCCIQFFLGIYFSSNGFKQTSFQPRS